MFKTKSANIEKLIKAAGSSIKVTINPEKPRKGSFVVNAGGTICCSLLAMPRPFTKLRELDLEKVAKDAVAALNKAK